MIECNFWHVGEGDKIAFTLASFLIDHHIAIRIYEPNFYLSGTVVPDKDKMV